VAQLRFGGGEEMQRKVIEAILNTETTFFRDFSMFEAFRTAALPDLLKRRGTERRLNLWSAACSTGQEPYSLAMILHQVQPPLGGWSVRLLASDLSAGVLEYARAGRYTQAEVNRGLPAGFLVSCFEQVNSHWVVREEIRRKIEFQRINLMGPWPLWGAMDAIFLRNILIYFEMEARRGVLRRLRGALKPDGYLFLGGTETIINVDDGFESVPMGRAVAYRLKPSAGVGL
jgi:chemotaxis protein methyltransferase CheR